MRVDAESVALATDLYELTMGGSYAALGMRAPATFSLFVRTLPANRAFLVAAGLEEALARLQELRFDPPALNYLRTLGSIRPDFIDTLANLRFTGEVRAVPEGRVVFANEPLLEVHAPIIEAQLAETILVNALHFPTLVATKAARCVLAAPGKALIDFGLRRTPSIDAGLAVARAAYLAGFAATSNVLAGQQFSIPLAGTVAHAFVETFPSERASFMAFAATFPGPATLLIDSYDTLAGARNAVETAKEMATSDRHLLAVRLDSGDLASLSGAVRRILDAAGLSEVQIVASGGLDEYELAALTRGGAPIDAYGVGTRLGTSADAPMLDMAYKLVEYDGVPRLKLSSGKQTLVGPKQVWRRRGAEGHFAGDVIAAADERPPDGDCEPLLETVLRGGTMLVRASLEATRDRHRREMSLLPDELRRLTGRGRYPVRISPTLRRRQASAVAAIRRREGLSGPSTLERSPNSPHR